MFLLKAHCCVCVFVDSLKEELFKKKKTQVHILLDIRLKFSNPPPILSCEISRFYTMKNKPFFCLEALDIRMCAVTEATDRDGSAQVVEGLASNRRHCVEEFVGRRERRQASVETRVFSQIGLWEAHREQPAPSNNSLGPWSVPVKFPS